MPMIDVYATGGTFADPKALARDLASTLMKIEQVPDIPMFRKNTAGFIHDLPDGALSNVDGRPRTRNARRDLGSAQLKHAHDPSMPHRGPGCPALDLVVCTSTRV